MGWWFVVKKKYNGGLKILEEGGMEDLSNSFMRKLKARHCNCV